MKRLMNVLAVLLLTVLVSTPAFAQQQSPKGADVPEVRKPEGKSAEGSSLPKEQKKQ